MNLLKLKKLGGIYAKKTFPSPVADRRIDMGGSVRPVGR
jgi:hypothetical protein